MNPVKMIEKLNSVISSLAPIPAMKANIDHLKDVIQWLKDLNTQLRMEKSDLLKELNNLRIKNADLEREKKVLDKEAHRLQSAQLENDSEERSERNRVMHNSVEYRFNDRGEFIAICCPNCHNTASGSENGPVRHHRICCGPCKWGVNASMKHVKRQESIEAAREKWKKQQE